jgi:hypothetical protein
MDTESALGTAAGAAKDIRLEEAPTIPTDTVQLERQANMGQSNASSFSDPPIPFETIREGALTVPIAIRRGATTGVPPLMTMLESAGWLVTNSAVDTTIAAGGYQSATDFDLDASLFGAADAYNVAVLVELDNGVYHPTLLYMYDDAPDKTCLAMMGLPSGGGSDGNAVIVMRSATVFPRQVPTTKTLQFDVSTRGTYDGDDNDLNVLCTGCAMSDLGEITINNEGIVKINPVFHVADVTHQEVDLTTDDFAEGNGTDAATSFPTVHQTSSSFRFQFGDYVAAGEISASCLQMLSATIRPNITTVFIEGHGCGSTLNGVQGYMQVVAQPEVELQLLMDEDYFSGASNGVESLDANVDKTIIFSWGTTDLDRTAALIALPRCEQVIAPTFAPFGETKQVMTATYGAKAPALTGASVANGSTGMSPIVIAIHGQD